MIEYNEELNSYVDENDNSWQANLFSKEQAEKMSRSLKECKKCINCYKCNNCFECSGCINCENAQYLKNCHDKII